MPSDNQQLPCLFCFSPSSEPQEGFQQTQVQRVCKFLCDILGVNLPVEHHSEYFPHNSDGFEFLPFCVDCSIVFRNVSDLQDQLIEIQEKVFTIGEEIRNKVYTSEESSTIIHLKPAEVGNPSLESNSSEQSECFSWVQSFRQNIIQQKAPIPSEEVTFIVTEDESQQIVIEDPSLEHILHVGSYETIQDDDPSAFYVTEEVLTIPDHNVPSSDQQESENPESSNYDHLEFREDNLVLNTTSVKTFPFKDERLSTKTKVVPNTRKRSVKFRKTSKPSILKPVKVVFNEEELAKRKYKCHICDKSYLRSSHLKVHIIQHSDIKTIACELCQERFSTVRALKKHNQEVHGHALPFACEICEARRISTRALKIHCKVHELGKTGPFKCHICQGRIFHNKNSFKRHIESHDKSKLFDCPLCSVKCSRKDDFMKHMTRKHRNEQLPHGQLTFQCNVCPLDYPNATELITHLWSHGSKKSPTCILCQLIFSTVDELNAHNEDVHGFKPIRLSCPNCSLVLTSEKLFLHHMKIHKPDNKTQAECNLCKRQFYDQSTLKRHISRIHQKLNCNSCNLTFDLRDDFTSHLKLHKQEKDDSNELQCTYCGMYQDSFANLRVHIDSHTGGQSSSSINKSKNFKIIVTPLEAST